MSLKGLRSHSPLAIRTDYSMLELVLFYDTQSVWHPSPWAVSHFLLRWLNHFQFYFITRGLLEETSKTEGLAYNNNEIFLSLGS